MEALEEKALEIRSKRQRLSEAIQVIEEVQLTLHQETCARLALDPHEADNRTQDTDLFGLVVSFEGITNLKGRVLRIAQVATKADKILNTSAVSKYLIHCGQSKSAMRNLRPSVHRVFNEQPEVYEKIGAGNWKMIQQSEDERYGSEKEVQAQFDGNQPTFTGIGSPEADHRG